MIIPCCIMKLLFIFLLLNVFLHSQNIDSLTIKKSPQILEQGKKDSVLTDTTSIFSTQKKIVKADTLLPLQQKPLFDGSYFISHKTIFHYDYRYAADLLREYPFTFVQDKGFIGQANQVFIYGAGAGGISFLQDGILYNDRFSNSLDLNNIQSEFVDSIEIIPSPRGFLYGISPNPVSVNFITKDYLSVTPYSRVKYYQGPSGEAFVDGLFSAMLVKDLNVSFDITNRSVDSSFGNSDFNIWQVKTRLKYFLSNSFNIVGTYVYIKSEKGLNGGINVDSIAKIDPAINNILYDNVTAPVNFPYRKEEYIQHYFNINLLSNAFKNFNGNLDFYFRFNQDKIYDINSSISEEKNKNKIYGINFNQGYSNELFKISLLGNFEHINYNTSTIENKIYAITNNNLNSLSLASIASLKLLNENLIPSVFYKYFNGKDFYKGNMNLHGLGADVTYKLDEKFKFYFGYSNYQIIQSSKNINNAEASINYSDKNTSLIFKAFNRNAALGASSSGTYLYDFKNLTGFGLNIYYKFEQILVEASGEYYLNAKKNFENLMPDLNFIGGLYYKDILFHSNLNLKTGFVFYFTGEQNLPSIYSSHVLNYFDNKISPSLKIDFTLVGQIRKVAIVYFTWENLLNNQYFITPFYPMPSRGIRFGIGWELFN